MRGSLVTLLAAAVLPALGACGSDTPTAADTTALAAVMPAGGAAGVAVSGVVTVKFSHAMMSGMEAYAALHEGDVIGAVVAGSWTLSYDRTTLTFTPSAPLEATARYTIHLGGGMQDADGHEVNLDPGQMMGGQYASGSMMTGGGMMQGSSSMMGSGWLGPNRTFGMVFTFTTS